MPVPLPQFDAWMTSTGLSSFNRREQELIVFDEFLRAYLQFRAKSALDGLDQAMQDYRRAVPRWRTSNRNRSGMMTRTFLSISDLVEPGLQRQGYIWSPLHALKKIEKPPKATSVEAARIEAENKAFAKFQDNEVHDAFANMQRELNLFPNWLGGGKPTDLGKFSPNATLYILAHGHSEMPIFKIGSGKWTADQLAELLMKDGLRIDQKNIVMLVCHAGESVNTKAAGNAMWAVQQQFAVLSAAEMKNVPVLAGAVKTQAAIEARKKVLTGKYAQIKAGPNYHGPQLFEKAENPEKLLLPMAAQLSAALKARGYDSFMLTSFKAPVNVKLHNGSISLDLKSVRADPDLAAIFDYSDVPIEKAPGYVARWR